MGFLSWLIPRSRGYVGVPPKPLLTEPGLSFDNYSTKMSQHYQAKYTNIAADIETVDKSWLPSFMKSWVVKELTGDLAKAYDKAWDHTPSSLIGEHGQFIAPPPSYQSFFPDEPPPSYASLHITRGSDLTP